MKIDIKGFIPWDDDIDIGMPDNRFIKQIHKISLLYSRQYLNILFLVNS